MIDITKKLMTLERKNVVFKLESSRIFENYLGYHGGGGSTSAKYRQIGVLSKVRDETQVLKASNISQIGCFEEE